MDFFYYFQSCFNAKLWNIYKLRVFQELIKKGEISNKKEEKNSNYSSLCRDRLSGSRQTSKQMDRELCRNNILCVTTQDLKIGR